MNVAPDGFLWLIKSGSYSWGVAGDIIQVALDDCLCVSFFICGISPVRSP